MNQAEFDGIDWRGSDEGGEMKEPGTTHWIYPNPGTTNESGFTALPGGYRGSNGAFDTLGMTAFFWISTESPRTVHFCTLNTSN